MLFALSLVFGAIVGFALGLTGGGGSLLAVPLLVYGLSVAPREAFGVSLAAVGATALVGVVPRIKSGQVEVATGVLFAVAGMIGAPLGLWMSARIPESILLTLFSLLMLVMAAQMWAKTQRRGDGTSGEVCRSNTNNGATCQRSEDGRLRFTSACAILLVIVGLATGFLSGMFGVGGGFVIVPALVLFSGMSIHRAVGTSLLVIVLVSLSGVASHFAAGRGISLEITSLFVLGGVLGLAPAGIVANHLSPKVMQRVFALGIVVVALFIVSKTFI